MNEKHWEDYMGGHVTTEEYADAYHKLSDSELGRQIAADLAKLYPDDLNAEQIKQIANGLLDEVRPDARRTTIDEEWPNLRIPPSLRGIYRMWAHDGTWWNADNAPFPLARTFRNASTGQWQVDLHEAGISACANRDKAEETALDYILDMILAEIDNEADRDA